MELYADEGERRTSIEDNVDEFWSAGYFTDGSGWIEAPDETSQDASARRIAIRDQHGLCGARV